LENVNIFYVRAFGILFGHLKYFITIWFFCVHFSCFGIMHQEKSGNPVYDTYGNMFLDKKCGKAISRTKAA
jgi:hypothetical protein